MHEEQKVQGNDLVLAAGRGNLAEVERLLALGADIECRSPPPKGEFNQGEMQVCKIYDDNTIGVYSESQSLGWPVPVKNCGRTPLQAAAEGGHEKVVALLVSKLCNVNAPPAPAFGRTALQAAAEGGYEGVVKLLVQNGAEINAQPARELGRTALQAAAGGGHKKVVAFLVEHGANVNAPPVMVGGRSALQAAAWGGYKEVLELLVDAKADLDERDSSGGNMLHQVCLDGKHSILGLLLALTKFDVNGRDFSGSTPLHIAAWEADKQGITALLGAGADVNLKDYSGYTPLQLALKKGEDEPVRLLLKKGATTTSLGVDKLPRLLSALGEGYNCPIIALRGGQNQVWAVRGTDVAGTSVNRSQLWVAEPEVTTQSIYFHNPISGQGLDSQSFADPSAYLEGYTPGERQGNVVEWAWGADSARGGKRTCKFTMGIPNRQEISCLKPTQVAFIGYISFDFPHVPGTKTDQFRYPKRKVDISWIMKTPRGGGPGGNCLKSAKYWGTLNLKYLSIPTNAVEFFTLFLDDISQSWLALIGEAKEHLAKIHDGQLQSAGNDPKVIVCFLWHLRQWNKLSMHLQGHLRESNRILATFKSHDVLYRELMEDDNDGTDSMASQSIRSGRENSWAGRKELVEELEAIKDLSQKIEDFERECKAAMSCLQNETQEMIDLALNLVSVSDSQRSMSMSMSMKRLSWVTFFMLPLTFAAGLFGMNVNALKNNPSWLWYLAISVPVISLILLIWIVFKYSDIEDWIEGTIGTWLRSLSKRISSRHRRKVDDEETGAVPLLSRQETA